MIQKAAYISPRSRLQSVGDELVHQLQGDLRLIHWHHMATIVDAQKREIAQSLGLSNGSSNLSIHLPFDRLCAREFLLSFPRQRQRPCLIPQPVTDKVQISGVDESADTILNRTHNFLLIILHPVRLQSHIHQRIAALPFHIPLRSVPEPSCCSTTWSP